MSMRLCSSHIRFEEFWIEFNHFVTSLDTLNVILQVNLAHRNIAHNGHFEIALHAALKLSNKCITEKFILIISFTFLIFNVLLFIILHFFYYLL